MSSTAVNIKSAWSPFCAARISLNVCKHDDYTRQLDEYATMGINTGAAYVQMYLTPAELEELENMCALARKELRDMAEVTA